MSEKQAIESAAGRPASRRRGASGLGWLSPLWPLLFLLAIWAGERLVGERWWLTTWALYLPQPLYLVPSAALAILAYLLRRWRALAGQAAVALLGVLLLFGGAWRLPRAPRRGELRVMTW